MQLNNKLLFFFIQNEKLLYTHEMLGTNFNISGDWIK